MLKNLNTTLLNIIIALVMLFTTFLGYLYTNDDYIASAMWPAIGFAVGFYYIFGKKSLIGLISGVLIANLIARFFLIDEKIILTIMFSLVFTFGNVVEVFLFNHVMGITKKAKSLSVKIALMYCFAAIATGIIGAIISVSFIYITNNCDNFLSTFARWSIGDFFGIIIFGTAIIFSYNYDKKYDITSKVSILGIFFLIFFILFSYAIFSEQIIWLSYNDFSFIFLIFFFTAAFTFSYRMILTIDIIFVLMFNLSVFTINTTPSLANIVHNMNLYLFTLSAIAMITKFILNNLEERNALLKESTSKFKNLVESTNTLLKLSDDLLKPETSVNTEYLKRMFEIATNLFSSYDTASCFVWGLEKPIFISTVGYDLDELNTYDFHIEHFEIDMNKPMHESNTEELIAYDLGQDYGRYKLKNKRIIDTVKLGIFTEDRVHSIMSFNITEGSDKTFETHHIEAFSNFQNLMNSFYEVTYLFSKTNSLKNDIVLSLIRTLELYDHYTGGHSEEVAYLAGQIASKLNLDSKEIYNIYWAGIVHDIGKIGIPSAIINKPDKLTLEEYGQIQDHPVFGYQILSKSEDLKEIAQLVRYHHEWWNGEGYPNGLKEDEIPLGAQILAICDAVSTMATKRPYTLVKSSREIIIELDLYKGIQFAPKPTEAMIDFIKEGMLDNFYNDK